MKKKLIPLLMASLCVMSLFGCSGKFASTENETINPMSPESTETEVNSENPDSESVEYISSIFTSPERQILFDTYQDCYCLSSKRYLMERIDSDTKPTNYYPDNTNGELAMESFRDIDITTLTSGGTMLENQIKITKPDGSCYAFENITLIIVLT